MTGAMAAHMKAMSHVMKYCLGSSRGPRWFRNPYWELLGLVRFGGFSWSWLGGRSGGNFPMFLVVHPIERQTWSLAQRAWGHHHHELGISNVRGGVLLGLSWCSLWQT
jgi:hypothetical protein